MFKKCILGAIVALSVSAFVGIPKIAQAQTLPPEETVIVSQNDTVPLGAVLRAPMPYNRSLVGYHTARSALTLGFAYIYVKADVTIDGQYNRIMNVRGVYSYYADVSYNFTNWEQLSITYKKYNNYVWIKVTGYAYFNTLQGWADKQYVEFSRNLYI